MPTSLVAGAAFGLFAFFAAFGLFEIFLVAAGFTDLVTGIGGVCSTDFFSGGFETVGEEEGGDGSEVDDDASAGFELKGGAATGGVFGSWISFFTSGKVASGFTATARFRSRPSASGKYAASRV